MQARIATVAPLQFGLRPALDHLAEVEDMDDVGARDGREAMGNHDGRTAARQGLQRGLNDPLGFAVELARREE